MYNTDVLKSSLELLLAFVILVFIVYPFVVSASNRLINGFWSSYWRTWATVVLTGIAAVIVTAIVAYPLRDAGDMGTGAMWVLNVIGIIVTVLVGGAILNAFVRRKDNSPVGYGRAALVCLVLGIVVVLIGLGLGPWQKSVAKKIKAGMPTPASVSSAPAAPTSAPATGSTAPAAASSSASATTAPMPATSTPASGATVAPAASVASE